jgi:hypothetical protein
VTLIGGKKAEALIFLIENLRLGRYRLVMNLLHGYAVSNKHAEAGCNASLKGLFLSQRRQERKEMLTSGSLGEKP